MALVLLSIIPTAFQLTSVVNFNIPKPVKISTGIRLEGHET